MVIVAVNGKAVCGEEVVVVAVVVLVFRTYIVMADSRFQTVRVHDHKLMRIGAVTGISDKVRDVEGKHQSYTSFDSSSSTFVMNFSARIMVSSSQSPPRVTSKPSHPHLLMMGLISISVLAAS